MTRQRAHTIWTVLLTVAVVLFAVMLFVTRNQVSDANQHIRDLTRASHKLAAAASQHASTASQTAVQASQLAQAIQQERRDTIRSACLAQNGRHDATIHTLNVVLGRALHRRLSRGRRIEIQASRASTVLLINALVPHQDCKSLVTVATGATAP